MSKRLKKKHYTANLYKSKPISIIRFIIYINLFVKYIFYVSYTAGEFLGVVRTERDSVTRKVFKLRVWGDRLDTKDVTDPYFIVLNGPFNLLRIFKYGFHRS